MCEWRMQLLLRLLGPTLQYTYALPRTLSPILFSSSFQIIATYFCPLSFFSFSSFSFSNWSEQKSATMTVVAMGHARQGTRAGVLLGTTALTTANAVCERARGREGERGTRVREESEKDERGKEGRGESSEERVADTRALQFGSLGF